MIRLPPRSTQSRSSAASDVYKRQVIDTSNTTVHQLSYRIGHIYGSGDDQKTRFLIMSFGFKNGVPVDADMVFDVRFLPNPHWVPHLRPQTGLSVEVSQLSLIHISEPTRPY